MTVSLVWLLNTSMLEVVPDILKVTLTVNPRKLATVKFSFVEELDATTHRAEKPMRWSRSDALANSVKLVRTAIGRLSLRPRLKATGYSRLMFSEMRGRSFTGEEIRGVKSGRPEKNNEMMRMAPT